MTRSLSLAAVLAWKVFVWILDLAIVLGMYTHTEPGSPEAKRRPREGRIVVRSGRSPFGRANTLLNH
jgi:hypothetical protein